MSAFRNGELQNRTSYPVTDVVMYYYYLGRLKLFEDRYPEARGCLLLALRHVPRSAACLRNRQRIMVNLVAVNVSRVSVLLFGSDPYLDLPVLIVISPFFALYLYLYL